MEAKIFSSRRCAHIQFRITWRRLSALSKYNRLVLRSLQALSTLGLSGILISHTLPYVFLTLRPLLSLFGRLGGRARGQRLTGREANGLQRQLESSQQYNATPYQPQSPNLESRDPEPDEHASPPPDALQRGGRTMISPEKAAEVTRKATEDAIGQLIDKEPKFFLNLLKRHHVRNLLLCIECAY